MFVIGLLIYGLIIGALGRLVHPGRDPMPIWLTLVIGVVATLVAGLLIGGLIGFILAVLIAAGLVALVGSQYRGRTI